MTHLYQETSVRSLYTDRKFGAERGVEGAIQNSTTRSTSATDSLYTTQLRSSCSSSAARAR